MPINVLLTRYVVKADVVTDLCLKGECSNSILLHCMIVNVTGVSHSHTVK